MLAFLNPGQCQYNQTGFIFTQKKMKPVYWILTIVGLILPSVLVLQESLETGNYLLYADPLATLKGMFANRISSIFALDLLFGVLVFMIWSWRENRLPRRRLLLVWAITFLFGFAGGFPLYLGWREKA